ncbi:MAG: hypothetical protein ACOZIN_11370 [Myxococcota bacterium]
MLAAEPFATKIPGDLKRALDKVCRRFGLRKSHVVAEALKEKLEDLLDAFELEEARRTATSFSSWKEVEKELKKREGR